MCDLSDIDICDVWVEDAHLARKAHRCSSCGGLIARREPYLRHFSVGAGDVTNDKMCGPCWFAREEFTEAHGTCVQPSQLRFWLTECFGEESREWWNDEDRRWRSLYAGILLRGRAAKRALAAKEMA